MACEILDCCRFFNDNMKNFPKTTEYIRKKLCFGDFESCDRFRIYKAAGEGEIPLDLYPDTTEEVKKVMRCLRNKQQPGE